MDFPRTEPMGGPRVVELVGGGSVINGAYPVLIYWAILKKKPQLQGQYRESTISVLPSWGSQY